MQSLYKHRCIPTGEKLQTAVYDSFFNNQKHAPSSQPSTPVEFVRGTYNWKHWLCEFVPAGEKKSATAGREVKGFARIGPDNLRPHQFFFELVGAAGEQYVGMNYKRFACDKACWNTTKDIVLLNYTPDIDDLMPAPLKNDFVATVQECLKSASGKCEDKDCPRCRLLRAFEVTCNM